MISECHFKTNSLDWYCYDCSQRESSYVSKLACYQEVIQLLRYTEAEGGHPILLRNFIYCFEVFQKYSIQILFSIIRWNIKQLNSYIPTLTGNISLRSMARVLASLH